MRPPDRGGERIIYTPLVLVAGLAAQAAVSPPASAQPPPAPAAPVQTAQSPPAPGRHEVRIGLTTDPLQARFFASRGLVILHPTKMTPLWKPRFDEAVVVVLDLPKGITPRSVFRVQVGSFATEEEAETARNELARQIPDPVVVSFNPDRNSYRVRAGQFERREDAGGLIDRLLDSGFPELWVAEEPGPASGKARLRLVDSRYYSQLTEVPSLLIQPSEPGGTLEVNGQPYRGKMEVRILGDSLKVINQLGIEEYLDGVVPNELGPATYPELEALKAQAVAARTYVVANRGQFSDSGYDICDSSACQVYKGFATEHPLSNRAVEETAGMIAVYNGSPIKTLYTSTCGGHTEDGGNIFPDMKFPYLKGVECYPEAGEPPVLRGRDDLPSVELPGGGAVSAEVGILFVSGVVGEEVFRRKYLQEETSPEEVQLWWKRAFGLVGAGEAPPGFRFERGDLLEWSRFLLRAFGWGERAKITLDERDLPYLLAQKDAGDIPPTDRLGVAFLLEKGILSPFPDGTLRPHARPLRGQVLQWIYRIVDGYQALPMARGSFRGLTEGTVRIQRKGNLETLSVAPALCLYRRVQDRTYPSPRLPIALGDELSFHLNATGKIDVVVLESAERGAADDRFSAYYRWEVRYTRQELEDLINKRVDVGKLADISVARRGVSGRVTQIKVAGSRGTFTLSGFKIRTALGIRETLFTVERQADPGGGVRAFTFAGKGWGHGVGLCQVGAYGMAVRGATFDAILRHYYSGIELVRMN